MIAGRNKSILSEEWGLGEGAENTNIMHALCKKRERTRKGMRKEPKLSKNQRIPQKFAPSILTKIINCFKQCNSYTHRK